MRLEGGGPFGFRLVETESGHDLLRVDKVEQSYR